MELDTKFQRPREYRASGTVTRGQSQVSAGWSKRAVIPGLPSFGEAQRGALPERRRRVERPRPPHRRPVRDVLQHQARRRSPQDRMLVYYNSQCCGIAVDYRNTRPGQGSVLLARGNRTFNLIFTLAGIGSFANPFGAFGGGGGCSAIIAVDERPDSERREGHPPPSHHLHARQTARSGRQQAGALLRPRGARRRRHPRHRHRRRRHAGGDSRGRRRRQRGGTRASPTSSRTRRAGSRTRCSSARRSSTATRS